MPDSHKFRIAIIGSGPVGKLLVSSVSPHPRIEYVQFESDTLPLRPSFGYGVGPQTLTTTMRLNPAIGIELRKQCLIGPVWMNFRHGGAEDSALPTIEVPNGKYGRIGREELLDLLDSFRPKDVPGTQYGKKLKSVEMIEGELNLEFEDGTMHKVDALWACDGMNSLCRRLVQGSDHKPPEYSGMIVFRGKVESQKVVESIGETFATETHMFIGVKGWHVLTFPIARGKFVNIAAFAVAEVREKRGREYKTSIEELSNYFPNANNTVQTFLRLLNDEPDAQCLDLTYMPKLGAFYNKELGITTFGDAANGMLPHIAGSMSTGFIGITTFLKEEMNPRIKSLDSNASKTEIAEAIMEASAGYEAKHRPLAQKLVDYSAEQGGIFSGGVTDAETLSKRPGFLWRTVD